jgi:hypothetical protein
MSTVTTTILIGSSHPNDVGVNPQLIIKLWEGDRVAWTAHALADPTFEQRSEPKAPEDIAADGAQLVMALAREFDMNAVMVCAIEKSSLLGQLKSFADALTDLDVHVLTSSGSRTYSQWSKEWTATGVLA